jgi:hypothetical protein
MGPIHPQEPLMRVSKFTPSAQDTSEYLSNYFKVKGAALLPALQARGWDGTQDFIDDVGLRPTHLHSLVSKKRLQDLKEGAAAHYYPNRKGEVCWCVRNPDPKPSTRKRQTLLDSIGAKKDPEDPSHPLYKLWTGMLHRCYDPNASGYDSYRDRKPNAEWLVFKNFARDMGERPAGHTIERVNNELGYSAENCVWATKAQQARNTRNNVSITYKGKKWILVELSEHLNVAVDTLRYRIKNNWPEEEWTGPTEEGLKLRQAAAINRFATQATIDGVTLSVKDWSRKFGLNHDDYIKALGDIKAGKEPKAALEDVAKRAASRTPKK